VTTPIERLIDQTCGMAVQVTASQPARNITIKCPHCKRQIVRGLLQNIDPPDAVRSEVICPECMKAGKAMIHRDFDKHGQEIHEE